MAVDVSVMMSCTDVHQVTMVTPILQQWSPQIGFPRKATGLRGASLWPDKFNPVSEAEAGFDLV